MPYQIKARWIKGAENEIADALSRNPIGKAEEELAESKVSFGHIRALHAEEMPLKLTEIINARDEEYRMLEKIIMDGFLD